MEEEVVVNNQFYSVFLSTVDDAILLHCTAGKDETYVHLTASEAEDLIIELQRQLNNRQ